MGVLALLPESVAAQEVLPSWNESATRQAIVSFVERVTTPGSPQFVSPAERIATFDNDGTLWCESPMYVQARFTMDRIRVLSASHPEWTTQEPFASALRDDPHGMMALGEKGIFELMAATHAGMTVDEFRESVTSWLKQARHPRFQRKYTTLSYQPMLEVLEYLRAHGFKTYIVSGGGMEFMRPWTESVYGIPPEQVIGSYGQLAWEFEAGHPVLRKLAKVGLIDDKQGKPIGIQTFIGRRPIAAFGNSDGDLEMLQWTTTGPGARLGMIVHHTDAEREYAYDRNSSVGRLDKGLDAAPRQGWLVIDMKTDWNVIFPELRDR